MMMTPAMSPEPVALFRHRVNTPIGVALVVSDEEERLRALDWDDHETRLLRLLRLHYGSRVPLEDRPEPEPIRGALDAYFAGRLDAFTSLSCATGGTPFQRRVWAALRDIPAGKTESYGTLAARIGSPRAVRAVGLANGANPIGLVVPCHRVIGSDGSLTGYGGGLPRKRWLLLHEGVTLARTHETEASRKRQERHQPAGAVTDQP